MNIIKKIGGLSFATILAQFCGLLNIVIMAQIFTQEYIGTYTVLLSYAGIIATVSLCSYDLSLPNLSHREASIIVWGLSFLLTIITLAVYVIFGLGGYEYALALALLVMGMGLMRLSEMLNIREGKFVIIAISRTAPQTLFLILLLLFSIIGERTEPELVWGYVGSILLTAVVYFYCTARNYLKCSFEYCKKLTAFVKNKRFPLFIMPAEFLNNAAYNLPVILIERYFGLGIAAQYGVVLRFCFGPVNILGGTIGKVYHSTLGEAVRTQDRQVYRMFVKIRKYLLFAGLLVGATIFFIFPVFIDIVLGPEWVEAAYMSRILSPMFAIMIVVAPLAVSFYVFECQKYELFSQISYFFISIMSFGCGIVFGSIWVGIYLFSGATVLRYMIIMNKINRLTNQRLTI